MRALAERGDPESLGSLRPQLLNEADHVWATKRAEEDELCLETAVIVDDVFPVSQTFP
uniref:Uncharacterized protein n=1 Tax=Physcomitrium patens TaxID=3218 RepID=A0A2K1JQM2_PHYPA|nr:hypothetical protein PHYPA_016205 [Physcomitrium patens]